MPELNQLVAENMQLAMKALHITPNDYADQIGVNYLRVTRRLKGEVPITLTDLETFCKTTGYKVTDLMDEDFVMKPTRVDGKAE